MPSRWLSVQLVSVRSRKCVLGGACSCSVRACLARTLCFDAQPWLVPVRIMVSWPSLCRKRMMLIHPGRRAGGGVQRAECGGGGECDGDGWAAAVQLGQHGHALLLAGLFGARGGGVRHWRDVPCGQETNPHCRRYNTPKCSLTLSRQIAWACIPRINAAFSSCVSCTTDLTHVTRYTVSVVPSSS